MVKRALGVRDTVCAGDDSGKLSEISHEMRVIGEAAVRGNCGDRRAVTLEHRLHRSVEAPHAEIANRRQARIIAKTRDDRLTAQARLAQRCADRHACGFAIGSIVRVLTTVKNATRPGAAGSVRMRPGERGIVERDDQLCAGARELMLARECGSVTPVPPQRFDDRVERRRRPHSDQAPTRRLSVLTVRNFASLRNRAYTKYVTRHVKRPIGARGAVAGSVAVLALVPLPSDAHEKWFLDAHQYSLRWDLFVSGGGLVAAALVACVVVTLAFVWRKRGRRDFIPPPERFGATAEGRRTIYALLPLIIGVHAAVPLFYDGSHGILFSQNNQLAGAPAYVCGIIEIWIGLSFLYGGLTRLAAIALAVLWVAGIPLVGLQSMLDNILFLGIAAFFFMAGRGPIAVDRFMFPALEPSPNLARHAVLALRLGIGASFTIVAFTEKFANLPFALAFLQRYPLNFTSFFHVPMSDATFILCAASVELLIGLSLFFGIFAREIIIVAWLPINLTLTYFNAVELIGHLPIYGIMALLLIWIPGRVNRDEWVAALALGRVKAPLTKALQHS